MRNPRKVAAVLALVLAVVAIVDPLHGFPFLPVAVGILAAGELIGNGYGG